MTTYNEKYQNLARVDCVFVFWKVMNPVNFIVTSCKYFTTLLVATIFSGGKIPIK